MIRLTDCEGTYTLKALKQYSLKDNTFDEYGKEIIESIEKQLKFSKEELGMCINCEIDIGAVLATTKNLRELEDAIEEMKND